MVIVRVSASQIEKWNGCPRAWAYSRLRPSIPSPWQEFGTRMHAILERWLQFGIVPNIIPPHDTPEDHAAFEGLPLLPMPPQPGVEHAFEFFYDGVLYIGRIDLLSAYVPRVRVLVSDHKSTGDLKWAKSSSELASDPQWLVYGYYAGEALDVEWIGGQWIYYRRKPPKAIDATIVQHRDVVRVAFEEQHRRVVLPLAASRAVMPIDPAMQELWIASHPRCENAGSRESYCSKFKGCPYRNECLGELSPLQLGMAAMGAA